MGKKILIAVLLIVIALSAGLYIYRHAIIRYYAEKMIRENLPAYIKIDKVNFDFVRRRITLNNFRILDPPGYSSEFLLKVSDISCKYGILGGGIPKGLEISDVSLSGADIRIERLKSGAVNASNMGGFVQSFPSKETQREGVKDANTAASNPSSQKAPTNQTSGKLSDFIKLPASFDIRNSKLAFTDNVPYRDPYTITVESITGQISLNFERDYSNITNLSFTLVGRLNGHQREPIQWVASLNPATPKITMSNRFDVSGLDLLTFEPYYDRFSPFVFNRGRFSGTLIFDFNNGDIGSTNEIHLSDLAFSVKPGQENAQLWGTTVPELLRYFTAPSGEIVFDFKLKGDMANPTFYLGPISKSALTSMAMDKIASYALNQVTKNQGGANNQTDKAKEAVDMVRQFLKKK